jgi:hypothetical protein
MKDTKELIDTIWMTKWKTWFHIYKDWEKYVVFVFNLVSDICMGVYFDTIQWARDYIHSIKPIDAKEFPQENITDLIPKPTFWEYIIAWVLILSLILFWVTALLACMWLCKYLISFIFFS